MKKMQKSAALLLALAMAFSLAACSSAGDAPTPAAFTTVEEGKLHMSTEAGFPPYEMTADDGGYKGTGFEGIDVEVAGAIAEKLGLELVVDDMEFDAALVAAQTGKSDIVMAGVTVDEERQAVMNFTDSYANGVQVIIVKEGSDVTLDNLGEQMIGTQRGFQASSRMITVSDTMLEELINLKR